MLMANTAQHGAGLLVKPAKRHPFARWLGLPKPEALRMLSHPIRVRFIKAIQRCPCFRIVERSNALIFDCIRCPDVSRVTSP